jgi:hypothetical protein
MKTLKMSIVLVSLIGLVATIEGKSEKVAKKAVVQGTYEELVAHYNELAKSFNKLEAQRATFASRNPSRDEMAKIDIKIATLRDEADKLYSTMGEFPQFSTFTGEKIPSSPRYMPTSEAYKKCMVDSKKLDTQVKSLTKKIGKK